MIAIPHLQWSYFTTKHLSVAVNTKLKYKNDTALNQHIRAVHTGFSFFVNMQKMEIFDCCDASHCLKDVFKCPWTIVFYTGFSDITESTAPEKKYSELVV